MAKPSKRSKDEAAPTSEDEILRRMLNTPPKPHKPKPEPKPKKTIKR